MVKKNCRITNTTVQRKKVHNVSAKKACHCVTPIAIAGPEVLPVISQAHNGAIIEASNCMIKYIKEDLGVIFDLF